MSARVLLDDPMRSQAERLRGPDGRYLLPPCPERAAWGTGRLLRSGSASALLRLDSWPEVDPRRAVIGDHTATLERVVLPRPDRDGAAADIAGLVGLAARYACAARLPGRTHLVLRWPSADAGLAAAFVAAGLRRDAVLGERAAHPPPGRAVEGVTVRPATPADAAVVGELVREENRYHLPISPFTADLTAIGSWAAAVVRAAGPDRPVFVAERAGRVVGHAVCELVDTPDDGRVHPDPPGRRGHLRTVGVTADARRSGVGTALTRGAADALTRAGATTLGVGFVPGNPSAEPFWLGLGFTPVHAVWQAVVAG